MIAILLVLILIAVLLCSEAGRAILAASIAVVFGFIVLAIGALLLFWGLQWLGTSEAEPFATVLGGAILSLVIGLAAVGFLQHQRDKTRKLWRVGEQDKGWKGLDYAPVVVGEMSEFAPRGHPAPYKAIKARVARLKRLTALGARPKRFKRRRTRGGEDTWL